MLSTRQDVVDALLQHQMNSVSALRTQKQNALSIRRGSIDLSLARMCLDLVDTLYGGVWVSSNYRHLFCLEIVLRQSLQSLNNI